MTEATFPDPRSRDAHPIRWEYRDPEFTQPPGFYALVEAAADTISTSYGWVQNRAAYVYAEAWREYWREEARAALRMLGLEEVPTGWQLDAMADAVRAAREARTADQA